MDGEAWLVLTNTLSQSQDLASRSWRDPGKISEDAKIVTGFPPSFPKQKTRASIFFSFVVAAVDGDDVLVLEAEDMALRTMESKNFLVLVMAGRKNQSISR